MKNKTYWFYCLTHRGATYQRIRDRNVNCVNTTGKLLKNTNKCMCYRSASFSKTAYEIGIVTVDSLRQSLTTSIQTVTFNGFDPKIDYTWGSAIWCFFFVSDVNECQTDHHGCEQTCNNLPGSYNCSCDTGFMLNNDSRTCSGKVQK